ncbi:MAG: hypothetical protein H0U74_05510 [Bradymonadaceae bacterium]|nr:hypothetical protein [Lujinxingiaceae bacterium]
MIAKNLTRCLITAALTLASATAFGQALDPTELPDFARGVRPAGMGEAYTAVASGTGGIYHNPAGVARTVMYSLEGLFEYTPSGSLLNAAVVDSRTNPVIAAGAAYSYFFGRGELSHLAGHDIRLAVGVPVVPERVSIGIGGRYLILRDSSGEKTVNIVQAFTLDAGVIFRVVDLVHLGVAGQNLIDPCDNAALCRGMAPTTITGGVAVGRETSFVLSGDVGFDLTSLEDPVLNFGVGAEYLIANVVPLRVGFKHRGAVDHNYLTLGGGWRSPSAGVDLSYQHDLQRSSEVGYIAGSFSLYF